MSRRCNTGGSGQPSGCWGIALIAGGVLLLLLALPSWLWMGLLGIVLIVLGFLLLRFG